MITKKTISTPASGARRNISASQSITSGVRNRQSNTTVNASVTLTPAQKAFVNQLNRNCRRPSAVTAATNTSNIMARPDFLELLPMFVQKLLVLDVFGSVAMRSRQQLIPYFKFIAENTKGETKAGEVKSSPFMNRQGSDPNWTGRIVKNEETDGTSLMYTPVLPGSLTLKIKGAETKSYIDNGAGQLMYQDSEVGSVNYATGEVTLNQPLEGSDQAFATYEYDNETVGPDAEGNYGAKMAKGYLALDEFNLVAEAHELACYWSIYSAFAAQQEYGANIGDIAKEAAISELTAEINSNCFKLLAQAAAPRPQFNWDASPVLTGAVVPSDYLNMFKLKLNQAAASVYQATRLTRPNRLVVGTNVASYISMIDSFKAEAASDNVGPYKVGSLDQFEIFCDPNYNPDLWVMCAKSNDIRRNSALFGEYMPITTTDAIGLANASVQQGYAAMYGAKVVVPETVVSGKILGVN